MVRLALVGTDSRTQEMTQTLIVARATKRIRVTAQRISTLRNTQRQTQSLTKSHRWRC